MKHAANEKLGEFIRRKRSELNITQTELGRRLGYTGQFIASWENGTSSPPANKLLDLIKALKLDEEELFRVLMEDSFHYWRNALSKKKRNMVG